MASGSEVMCWKKVDTPPLLVFLSGFYSSNLYLNKTESYKIKVKPHKDLSF